jgi:hypothetical protein
MLMEIHTLSCMATVGKDTRDGMEGRGRDISDGSLCEGIDRRSTDTHQRSGLSINPTDGIACFPRMVYERNKKPDLILIS